MDINFEKELTFTIDETTILNMIKYIFENGCVINGNRYVAKQVKISPAIHFYFENSTNDKSVYKFKNYQGAFILSNVKKSCIQKDDKFFNVEMVERVEYLENGNLDFGNICSILYKERMMIDFVEKDLRISFDRVIGVDPYNNSAYSLPFFFCEIEFENHKISFDELIEKFHLNYIQEPKYLIGRFDENVDLNELIYATGVSEYLNLLNSNLYSNFFEKFNTKYYFSGKNVELELKIKNSISGTRESLISNLEDYFVVSYEDASIIEDEYYDFYNILLAHNLSYRIRKTHNNQRKNLFLKVPQEDKGLFSSRIEYMNKFHNYSNDEIISCDCNVNRLLNNRFGCNLSNRLTKTMEIKTNRDVYLVLNKGEPPFLIGMLSFDESKCTVVGHGSELITLSEIEFEIYNDCITQTNFNDNYACLNTVFFKHSIDNSNKYLSAMRKLFKASLL